MSDVIQALENVGAHLKGEFDSVKARVENDLPVVAQFVQQASSNPVVAAISAAVHLPEAPELLQTFADMITKADAALGEAKAAAAAAAPAEPPAEPAPDASQPVA